MKYKFFLVSAILLSLSTQQMLAQSSKPNIIYILADDLGYGDISIYNKEGKINTPNIDKLAKQGMRFTDAHTTSGVCTPTRYSVMTGRYPWRSRLPQGVLNGYSRPLIENDRATVASLLKKYGYNTGVVGKWHLGLGWPMKAGNEAQLNNPYFGILKEVDSTMIDFGKDFSATPNTIGFDYSFVIPASLDMPPYGFVENMNFEEPITSYTKGQKPDTGYAGAFWRGGKMSPHFDFYDVIPSFERHANDFIKKQTSAKPFFLYLPFPAPHTPWVPASSAQGKSKVGEYGDFVQQLDATVGKLMHTLDSMGMSKNTIIVFTSDNGPYWRSDYISKYNHKAAGEFRGMKGDVYEAGHRVPFIVKWPGKVKPGTVSNATTSLANLYATSADIVGATAKVEMPEDSYSIMSVLLGKSNAVEGQPAITVSSSIGFLMIRQGDWKLIQGLGSGGFTQPKQIKPVPGGPTGQLFNLKDDPKEEHDLFLERPDKVKELSEMLNRLKQAKSRITSKD